jgi:hypothetical protein
MTHAQDPDDLYGDAPIARIEITCRRNGAMSVAGNIEDLRYALAILDNARDAIKSHHARKRAGNGGGLIVPPADLTL